MWLNVSQDLMFHIHALEAMCLEGGKTFPLCTLFKDEVPEIREGFKKDSNTFVRKFLSMILKNFQKMIGHGVWKKTSKASLCTVCNNEKSTR